MPKGKPKTVEEFVRELEQDPAYWERRREQEKHWAQMMDDSRKRAAPVIADLKAAGFNVRGVGDLNRCEKLDYQRAIPILLRWLARTDDPRLRSGIARTLTHKWAKPVAAPALVHAFRTLEHPLGLYRGLEHPVGNAKWTIGNALEVVADDSVFAELAEVARDRRHGRTREMVVLAFGKMKDPGAVDLLIGLLQDDDVAGHAIVALGKLKASRARSYIEPFTRHPKTWWRRAAKSALAKIERAEANEREKKRASKE